MHDNLGEGANQDQIYGGKHKTCSCDKEKEERSMLIECDMRASIGAIRPATNASAQATSLNPAM